MATSLNPLITQCCCMLGLVLFGAVATVLIARLRMGRLGGLK
jgi:hypothetical protein